MFRLFTMPTGITPAFMATLIHARASADVRLERFEGATGTEMSGTRSQFLRAGAMRLAKVALLSLVHQRALRPLLRAAPSSFLGRIVAERPEIRGMVLTPYVCATWDAPTRLARVADHCRIAERLGPPFTLASRDYVELLSLPRIGAGYHVRLDSPRWTTRDGLLMLSLWHEERRMFTLSFTLAETDGTLVAYVGGVQGQRGTGMLDLYRTFTKAAAGMRPRDMMVELFRMLCAGIGVAHIHGVSDANRYQQSRYLAPAGDPVELRYDAIWRDRGASLRTDGFFDLPVHAVRRSPAAMPPNKRSLYRRRYAMLDEIEAALTDAVRNPRTLVIRQHATGGEAARTSRRASAGKRTARRQPAVLSTGGTRS